jgi:MFS family permease
MSDARGGLRARVLEHLERTGRYPRWVLWVALTGMFATTFPVTILVVSLGDIAKDLQTSETTLAWVLTGPMLASAVALPVLGKMGDLYGQRRVFIVGFAGATIAALLTALSWGPGALIGFRTLALTIGAATQPTSMALVINVYEPRERVKALGWWSLVAAGGPSVGLVIGGPMIDYVGWRPLFLIQAVLGFVVLAAASLVLKEVRKHEPVKFDIAGSTWLTVGRERCSSCSVRDPSGDGRTPRCSSAWCSRRSVSTGSSVSSRWRPHPCSRSGTSATATSLRRRCAACSWAPRTWAAS